jgi:hypothetical protein
MNLRSFAAAILGSIATLCAHAQAMYQVPKAALEFRHDAIQAGVYEQDSFVLEERYPGMSAAEHYGRVSRSGRSVRRALPIGTHLAISNLRSQDSFTN